MIGGLEHLAEGAQVFVVYPLEIEIVDGLGGAEVIDDIVPRLLPLDGLLHRGAVVVVEHQEVEAAVGEITP